MSASKSIDILLIAVGDQAYDDRQAIPLGIAVLKGILQFHGFSIYQVYAAAHFTATSIFPF